MKDFKNIEQYKHILELVNSKWYVAYSHVLKYLIERYKEEIMKIDKEKNKVLYTEHDINRKLVGILNDLLRSPTRILGELWTEVQEDEESATKISKTIKKAKQVIGE